MLIEGVGSSCSVWQSRHPAYPSRSPRRAVWELLTGDGLSGMPALYMTALRRAYCVPCIRIRMHHPVVFHYAGRCSGTNVGVGRFHLLHLTRLVGYVGVLAAQLVRDLVGRMVIYCVWLIRGPVCGWIITGCVYYEVAVEGPGPAALDGSGPRPSVVDCTRGCSLEARLCPTSTSHTCEGLMMPRSSGRCG